MAKKESFGVAKKKLYMMKKLWQFHEKIMALPFPDFTSEKSIKRYADAYKKIVTESFLSPSIFYADLEAAGMIKILGYSPRGENLINLKWPFRDCYNIGLIFHRHHPYSRYDVSGNMYIDENRIKNIANTARYNARYNDYARGLQFWLQEVLEPIEDLLEYYPKPKTNVFQRIFGKKRYFKMEREVRVLGNTGR